MKALALIGTIASFLLLFSVLTCGLWIRYSGKAVDDSSIKFHVTLGVLTVAVVAVTLAVNMLALKHGTAA